MKCNICGEEVTTGSFGTMVGFVCKNPECEKKAAKKRKDFFAREWKAKDITGGGELNENLTLFAYHWLKEVKKHYPESYSKIRLNNPMMTIPEELMLDFTEKVINGLPPGYTESENARGHERLFHGGTFKIVKTIPKAVYVAAIIKAGLIKEYKED